VIVVASFTNVIGVHTVESANRAVRRDEVDQKELLFQTILDIANNKKIQNTIQKYDGRESVKWPLQTPEGNLLWMKLGMHGSVSLSLPPILMKAYLEFAYTIGTRLLKIFNVSRMLSIFEQYQVSHQGVQKEITAVIEKDATLNGEITQLSNSKCDCENDNTTRWNFSVLCLILYPIFFFIFALYFFTLMIFHAVPYLLQNLFAIIINIGSTLNCSWAYPYNMRK
jgi:hypothetical protein